jgi:hypothetical protein
VALAGKRQKHKKHRKYTPVRCVACAAQARFMSGRKSSPVKLACRAFGSVAKQSQRAASAGPFFRVSYAKCGGGDGDAVWFSGGARTFRAGHKSRRVSVLRHSRRGALLSDRHTTAAAAAATTQLITEARGVTAFRRPDARTFNLRAPLCTCGCVHLRPGEAPFVYANCFAFYANSGCRFFLLMRL